MNQTIRLQTHIKIAVDALNEAIAIAQSLKLLQTADDLIAALEKVEEIQANTPKK